MRVFDFFVFDEHQRNMSELFDAFFLVIKCENFQKCLKNLVNFVIQIHQKAKDYLDLFLFVINQIVFDFFL